MILGYEVIKKKYTRTSKTGTEHGYYRKRTIVKLRCDNCLKEFTREKGDMDPKRLSNDFYHVCKNCDAKRFAQKKGVEKRDVWKMPVSSLASINKL